MSRIDDNDLLSGISIPGTHDSAASGSIWPFVSTQKLDIGEQLNAGIRYFDLRCGLRHNVLEMVHGRALLGRTLDVVLSAMYAFLDAHPTEGLIVQLKHDRADEDSDLSFHAAVWAAVDAKPQYWRTFPTTPTMGELRGKIQVFRRFHGPPYRGIDVSRWEDNPAQPFTIHTWSGVQLVIQDHYSPTEPAPLPDFINRKGGDVARMLERASTDTDISRWYVNFVSAFEFNLYYRVQPREIAIGGYWDFRWVVGINPRLSQYLKTHFEKRKKVRYGIVIMDFPDQEPSTDLVRNVIASNSGRRKKKKMPDPVILMALLLFVIFMTGAVLRLVYGPAAPARCIPLFHACALRGDVRKVTLQDT